MKKIISPENIAKVAVPVLFLPSLVFAQNPGTVNSLLQNVRGTLNIIIGLLFVLVTLYFIWGVIQYVGAGGDEEKLKKGRQHMVWGIIGMAVMAMAWGIVGLLVNYFGVGNTNIVVPQVPTYNP